MIAIARVGERLRVEVVPRRQIPAGARLALEDAPAPELCHGLLCLPDGAADHARDPADRWIDARPIVGRKRRERRGVRFQPGRQGRVKDGRDKAPTHDSLLLGPDSL